MILLSLLLMSVGMGSITAAADSGDRGQGYRIEFDKTEKRYGVDFPQGWASRANKWGVAKTKFHVETEGAENVLVVEADQATGAIVFDVHRYVDLAKTPVMRWRWRVKKLADGADGRNPDKDDQTLVVYVGYGSMIRKSVAYRWDTETPAGSCGSVSYGGGMVKVAWFCLNNKATPLGKWVTIERNIAEDLKKAYGEVPKEFAISVGGNSQYTKSRSVGEIDYIEFLPSSR